MPFSPLDHELWYFREVIAVVCITHDDELATGLFDSSPQRISVPFDLGMDDPCAVLLGKLNRSVGRPVIGYDNLATHVGDLERREGLVDARRDRTDFVQAGDDDGD